MNFSIVFCALIVNLTIRYLINETYICNPITISNKYWVDNFPNIVNLFAFSQAITVNGTALTTASGAGSPSSCSGDYKLRGSGLNPSIVGNCVFLTDGTSTNGSGSISICAPLDLTNNFNLTFTETLEQMQDPRRYSFYFKW